MAEERDLQPGEMVYLDISSQRKPSYGGSNNWIFIQDLDRKKRSLGKKAKEYLNEKVTPLLKKMKTMKEKVKTIRCDNAGENKTLEETCAKNSEEIKFEFTSLGTPQKNGVVERRYATLYSWMRAMMVHAGLHENPKTGPWPKYAATVTKLGNIMVNPHEEKCAHEKFYGKIPDYKKYLRTLEEMGVVRSIHTAK